MVHGYGNGYNGEDDSDDVRYLWNELPHFTWDNYFSGDKGTTTFLVTKSLIAWVT
jgi:hypothetical protein